jgi:acyl-CoA thioester hydrolase
MTIQNTFPYISAPVVITQDMCDQNGHMNVLYYSRVFGQAIEDFYSEELGFSKAYFDSGFSSFTLEDNIKYIKECFYGESVFIRYRLHKVNKKLIHLVAVMVNKQDQLCAIYETVLGHIDMKLRKTSEMKESFFDNLSGRVKQHTRFDIDISLRLNIKSL